MSLTEQEVLHNKERAERLAEFRAKKAAQKARQIKLAVALIAIALIALAVNILVTTPPP